MNEVRRHEGQRLKHAIKGDLTQNGELAHMNLANWWTKNRPINNQRSCDRLWCHGAWSFMVLDQAWCFRSHGVQEPRCSGATVFRSHDAPGATVLQQSQCFSSCVAWSAVMLDCYDASSDMLPQEPRSFYSHDALGAVMLDKVWCFNSHDTSSSIMLLQLLLRSLPHLFLWRIDMKNQNKKSQ